ncbi:hypothetical protein [Bacillus stratosphericus]|uniref:hypothetical protein n=1 Tax=Bacillus stratosphericus TaxID=293386 RepID=UPI001CFAC4FA|nr:hypothetical protein [Bacillus stratosphericus]
MKQNGLCDRTKKRLVHFFMIRVRQRQYLSLSPLHHHTEIYNYFDSRIDIHLWKFFYCRSIKFTVSGMCLSRFVIKKGHFSKNPCSSDLKESVVIVSVFVIKRTDAIQSFNVTMTPLPFAH